MADDSGLSIDGPESLGGALVFLLLALALTGYGAYDYTQQSNAVENAVEVDATITEVGVESRSSSSTSGVDYEPRVRFEYAYDGETYEGAKLFPATTAPQYDTESAARDAVSAYESGETVTAYVVPSNPSDAFLRNRTSNAPLVLVAIGGVLSLGAGALTVRRLRER